MSLSQRLAEHVSACFTGLYVLSHEHDDALREVAQLCRQRRWALATWDVDRGLQSPGQANATPGTAGDPVAAIKSVNAMASPDGSALLVLPNFHRFLQSAEVVQALAHQIAVGKQNRTFVVILSAVMQVPPELEKLVVVIEHDLPDRPQLQKIAEGVATEPGELPQGEDLQKLLDAAAGLTRYEAEGAFSLSLVRQGRLTPQAVWELKAGTLKKGGLLTLHRGGERFADLGGLEPLKQFSLRLFSRRNPVAKPRGFMLLGLPGVGKSVFARALGNELGLPTLTLDVGSLMGGTVGSTEQNTRAALQTLRAMAPCLCFVDELDKAFAGVANGGQGDSGVLARLFGSLLTFLGDDASDVFFVATANDISRLPPEFTRSERFDAIWFLDLPTAAERAGIWDLYRGKFEVRQQQALPRDADWTGAEVRSCCRLSALLDVPLAEAARNVVPVAVTAAETIERLRTWAAGRCLDASRGGVYTRGAAAAAAPSAVGRKVTRPSTN